MLLIVVTAKSSKQDKGPPKPAAAAMNKKPAPVSKPTSAKSSKTTKSKAKGGKKWAQTIETNVAAFDWVGANLSSELFVHS